MIWGLLEKNSFIFIFPDGCGRQLNQEFQYLIYYQFRYGISSMANVYITYYLQLCSECAQDKITKDLGINVFSCAE